jgi:hypothetical protein
MDWDGVAAMRRSADSLRFRHAYHSRRRSNHVPRHVNRPLRRLWVIEVGRVAIEGFTPLMREKLLSRGCGHALGCMRGHSAVAGSSVRAMEKTDADLFFQ